MSTAWKSPLPFLCLTFHDRALISAIAHSNMRRQRLPDIEKLRHRTDLHFLHHIAAVKLHRKFADPKGEGYLFVDFAGDDKFQNLALAYREGFKQRNVSIGCRQ